MTKPPDCNKPVTKVTDTYLTDEEILKVLKEYFLDFIFMPENSSVGKDSKGFYVRKVTEV